MTHAKPVFVVGTGRSGTRSIFRMLRGNSRIEAHHEYGCESIQKVACLFSMGLITKAEALEKVYNHYHAAIDYCEKDLWLDSSNKASWIIPLLKEIFPSAAFIHVTRDPRRVVPSFYYKLREEMYDDKSVMALAHWVDSGYSENTSPPLEKKYWWKLELDDNLKVTSSEYSRSRFERCCLHWSNIVEQVNTSFSILPASSSLTMGLEALVTDKTSVEHFLDFLDLSYNDFYYDFIQKPRNVFLPLEFNCTHAQLLILHQYCHAAARRLGYNLSAELRSMAY